MHDLGIKGGKGVSNWPCFNIFLQFEFQDVKNYLSFDLYSFYWITAINGVNI